MGRLKLTIIGGLAAVALAAPATAAAAPGVADVRDRAGHARAALDYSLWAAEMGNVNHAAQAQNQFERIAKRAKRMSHRVEGRKPKARAMRIVARTNDVALDRYADVLDEVPAHVQGVIAGVIGDSADARQRALNVLTNLAERLPEPARSAVLDAVARFATNGEVDALVAALSSDVVANGVKATILDQLERISGHLDSVLDRLDQISAQLPPRAQEAIAGAIGTVRGHLEGLPDMIGGILAGLPIGGLDGGFADGLCGLLGNLPIPVAIPVACD